MAKKTIHVISGTHWDREWRYTAEQSLLRLADLVDDLLEVLDANSEYRCFLLDGGTVVLEDYLSIRPENKDRLKALFDEGRIETVMWYTLPEMNTVSPESLIRNLLIGKKVAEKSGAKITNVGYTATSYGQISQLAQIYKGFGMNAAMSYRGTNQQQVPSICKLQSPDGSQIYHIRCFDEVTRTNWFFYPHYMLVLGKLPRDLSTKWKLEEWPVHMADQETYQTAFQMKNEKFDFNSDPEAMKKALRMLSAQAEPQMINNQLLALDMEDNAVPYSNLTKMIKAFNELQDEYKIQQSTLDEYVNSCLDGFDTENLHVHKGEMRYTLIKAGFNGLLGATHSSRVLLKLMNDQAQRELINMAEPLSAMNSLFGGSYEHSLLDRAWLNLLKNHAHDSICGAAINEAHKDNPGRFRAVIDISKECSRKACEQLWTKIDTSKDFKEGDITLTFFNTLPVKRTSIESLVVDVPRPDFGDFPIEPCTGVGPVVEGFDPDEMLTFQYFDIIDSSGNKVPYKILERENIDMEVERKLDSNAAVYDIQRNRILIEVEVPPMGYSTYAVRPRKRDYEFNPAPKDNRDLIASPGGVLENEFVKVTINTNGTIDLLDKKSGISKTNLHYFCDDASTGNAHKHNGVMRDFAVTTLCNSARLTLTENSKLRATYKIDLELDIPQEADIDSRNRSENYQKVPVTTFITLSKGSRLVEFKTQIDNKAKDHQLRLMFPTDVDTDYAYADAPFDVAKRSILWDDVKDNMEGYHPYKPMQRFVSLSDDNQTFSFMSKGLGEYEVIDDTQRTLAVTLIRTNRVYMLANRGKLTPEEYAQNLGQQCFGKIEFEYTVKIDDCGFSETNIHNTADTYRVPLRVIQGVPKKGSLSADNTVIEIPNSEIQVSAFYKSSDADGYILRLFNISDELVRSDIKLNFPVSSVKKVKFDEHALEEDINLKDSQIPVKFRSKEIINLLIGS
jgi:mannosylglycerate hydrolase